MLAQGVEALDARLIAQKWYEKESKGGYVTKGFYYRMRKPSERYARSGDVRLISAW
jgi:hypothetical protein